MVTAGTYQKAHWFDTDDKIDSLCGGLHKYAQKHQWRLQAWAVFSNHYHFVATSPDAGAENLKGFIRELHSRSARWLNKQDGVTGRKVWHNYWESQITFEASYYARLNYVHQNAVKHGLVPVANLYPWCSAHWFEQNADPATVKTIYNFKTDRINVKDEF
ncbi:MAG: transposase [Akkermansiaceae bacterium]|nr:transposase [Akkermansiaceae bacterium]